MAKKSIIDWIAFALVIIGGINWGLTGFGFNLVEMLTGAGTIVTSIIYWIVGLAALYLIYYIIKK